MSELIEVESVHGKLTSFAGDFITNQILKFGAHTRPEIAFLLSVVEPGDAVFDLGAHIGTYAIALAGKIGRGGRLLAVEGSAGNFALLERNLRRNSHGAETLALHVLVAEPGRRYAAQTPDGNTGGTTFTQVETGGVTTGATTLDALCHDHFMPRVVKIDIEGGEVAALRGAELLARMRPILYAEVNGKVLQLQGASIGDMERLLRGAGYRLFRNIGKRHIASDDFTIAELDALPTGLNNFDVLAVHNADARLAGVVAAASGRRA
jgi:FkbM family methyltransferase